MFGKNVDDFDDGSQRNSSLLPPLFAKCTPLLVVEIEIERRGREFKIGEAIGEIVRAYKCKIGTTIKVSLEEKAVAPKFEFSE